MSTEKQKNEIKSRIAVMEKEILNLSGTERTKARTEYQKLIKYHSKECGLEEPIYITRA